MGSWAPAHQGVIKRVSFVHHEGDDGLRWEVKLTWREKAASSRSGRSKKDISKNVTP